MDAKEVKRLISEDKLDLAVEQIKKVNIFADKELDNRCTTIIAKFFLYKKDCHMLSHADKITNYSNIVYSLLFIVDEISSFLNDKNAYLMNGQYIEDDIIKVDFKSIEHSLECHVDELKKWTNFIDFKGNSNIKILTRVYVDLEYFLTPRRQLIEEYAQSQIGIPISDVFRRAKKNLVILGQPGSGKTTTMQKIAYDMIEERKIDFLKIYSKPLYIKLRELNNFKFKLNKSIGLSLLVEFVSDRLGISFLNTTLPNPRYSKYISSILEKEIIKIIDNEKLMIILDGFDELKEELRLEFIDELNNLSLYFVFSKIVLTSRSADFQYKLFNYSEFEICPLNSSQVKRFVSQWLESEQESNEFYEQLQISPYADTAMRPLNLAHLCAIYETYQRIPDKPKIIYKKIIEILLEEWDRQRGIKRQSQYSNFTPDRKFEFLCHFAYVLTCRFQKFIFTSMEMKEVYKIICDDFELPDSEAKSVVDELESHNGIFLQTGYDKYEFSHKSLQEYLTAYYLVTAPSVTEDINILRLIPNEIAISCALSSNPSDYLSKIILNKFAKNLQDDEFFIPFLSRLLIEKPDYGASAYLAVSLALLFVRKIAYKNDEKKSFIRFEKLFEIKNIRRSFAKLNELYYCNIDISIPTFNNNRQYLLNRKGGTPTKYPIPEKIILTGLMVKNMKEVIE